VQFQIPTEDGLVDWFERLHANLAANRLVLVACVQQDVSLRTSLRSPLSMPFYEERMGYMRDGAVFRKRLRS
jgi:hypothetical protein